VPSPTSKISIKLKFVNRKLIVTEIRSTELPGPIGIDVPNSATPPFSYSIVATCHPNRQYTTVLNGGGISVDLESFSDCYLFFTARLILNPQEAQDFIAGLDKNRVYRPPILAMRSTSCASGVLSLENTSRTNLPSIRV
jgi:hypothetical protein